MSTHPHADRVDCGVPAFRSSGRADHGNFRIQLMHPSRDFGTCGPALSPKIPAGTHSPKGPQYENASQAIQDAPSIESFGAGDEIRTHDPYLGKVMLYP